MMQRVVLLTMLSLCNALDTRSWLGPLVTYNPNAAHKFTRQDEILAVLSFASVVCLSGTKQSQYDNNKLQLRETKEWLIIT